MTTLWPLAVLIPPLVVTLFGGRIAWAWLSLSFGVAIVMAMVVFALSQLEQGQIESAMVRLFVGNAVQTAYHDTYYVFANFSAISAALLPGVIVGPLLLLPDHPRRTRIDFTLFWGAILSFCLASWGLSFLLSSVAAPRRYLEYTEFAQTYLVASRGLSLLGLVLVVIAGLRPIISFVRHRKAR